MIYARALGDALRHCLETDPRVILMGEDIADPYGGAFKVTRGLTTDFPERVRTTPISEAAITGVAAGLALRGRRPIVEIMFGDFLTLTFDQLLNHVAKYAAMYGDTVSCPVIVRSPSGGGRGYGPTHSQSLEKHFLGVPHVKVVAASSFHDPRDVLPALLRQDEPVLFVEHKLLYPLHVWDGAGGELSDLVHHEAVGESGLPTTTLSAVPGEDCTITIVAYGYVAAHAARLVEKLAVEDEIFAELVVPAQLAPLDIAPIEASVATTGALLTLEEGTRGWSWGTGIADEIGRRLFGRLRRPPVVLTSEPDVIPSARHLEERVLLTPATVERAMREAA